MSNENNITFSIIIPVFNEVKNIIETILNIEKAFKKLDQQYEIIFVDDNSTDGTDEK